MRASRREEFAYRIISDEHTIKIGDKYYLLKSPSSSVRHKAVILYNNTIKDNRFGDWVTPEYALELLVDNGICEPDIDSKLEQIDKRIEDLKVQLYNTLFKKPQNAAIKEELKKVKKKEEDMLNKRHMFDHLTLSGFAETIKRQFIICNTLYDESGINRIWNSIEEVDSVLMDRIVRAIYDSSFSASIIREISRTEPWRSHYSMNKDNPFNKPSTEYSDEQRTLIIFSKMYDSAREHPECPPDDIMEDDDLFDGWMIKERRKRESERTANEMEQRIGKNKKIRESSDVFVMAHSKDDARKIHMMNDINAKMIKKKREMAVKKQGEVKEGAFQDQRVEAQRKSQEQFIKKVKGK